MAATVSDIVDMMESIAPGRLAEDWDHVGLQVGRRDWAVQKVWVALDPTPALLDAASAKGVDLLVTHHPLIFRPLTHLDPSDPTAGMIARALEKRIAIFVAHTNLDAAPGGVNDILCERLGVVPSRPMQEPEKSAFYKFVVYAPIKHETSVLETLFANSVGVIGQYRDCTFRVKGIGTFRPKDAATPFSGSSGQLTHAEETRIEAIVPSSDLSRLIEQVRNAHPYEEMAFDVLPTMAPGHKVGLGRIGELRSPMTLDAFASGVADALELPLVRVAGAPYLTVQRVAVCSGSGSSLLSAFLSSGAQAYVSGDLKYHDARTAETAGRGLIDIGHFASEHLVVEALAQRMKHALGKSHPDVRVEAYTEESEPFRQLSGKGGTT